MNKPIVAIVGRPNVGKSTFFNKIAGRRISIVEDVPGVTRDRIHADAEWLGHAFTLVDTGGIDPHSDDALLSQMRSQAQTAMDLADVICFFTDGRDGLTDDDRDVDDGGVDHAQRDVPKRRKSHDGDDGRKQSRQHQSVDLFVLQCAVLLFEGSAHRIRPLRSLFRCPPLPRRRGRGALVLLFPKGIQYNLDNSTKLKKIK